MEKLFSFEYAVTGDGPIPRSENLGCASRRRAGGNSAEGTKNHERPPVLPHCRCPDGFGPDVDANLAEADRLIARPPPPGARLVALPANTSADHPRRDRQGSASASATARPDPGLPQGRGPAPLGVAGGGSIPLAAAPDKVRNSTLVFDDTGRRVARYDKCTCSASAARGERYDESATIGPGDVVGDLRRPCGRSGCRSATTCVFPNSSGRWAVVDRSSCPPPSPTPPAAPTGGAAAGPRHREPVLCAAECPGRGACPWTAGPGAIVIIIDPWGEVARGSCRRPGGGRRRRGIPQCIAGVRAPACRP